MLNEAGVPCSLIRTIPEILEHPQVTGRGQLHTFPDVEATQSDITVVGAAFRFEHDGPAMKSPPPTVGQHTEEILTEFGYSVADIDGLRAAHVI